jgi:hypothetical protein
LKNGMPGSSSETSPFTIDRKRQPCRTTEWTAAIFTSCLSRPSVE